MAQAPVQVTFKTVPMVEVKQEASNLGVTYQDVAINPLLFGANHRYGNHGSGGADESTGLTFGSLEKQISDAGLTLLRFPGGTTANTYRWSVATGAQQFRQNQVNGKVDTEIPLASTFGPDEFGKLLASVAAKGSLMLNFATQTPESAAHFVAYMTAKQGGRAIDGVDWAALRVSNNGLFEPYDIAYAEIGNETEFPDQQYWIRGNVEAINPSCADKKLMCLYAFGGSTSFQKQSAVKLDDWRQPASVSNGQKNQTFYARFRPVKPDSQTVFVGGIKWRPIDKLAHAAANSGVYEVQPSSGRIQFGDGVHGAIPPPGAAISVSYTSGPHGGFVDFYKKIKAVNPDIKVCLSIKDKSLLEILGPNNPYDCVVVHRYVSAAGQPNVNALFEKLAWQIQHILPREIAELRHHINSIAEKGKASKIELLFSEYGVLGTSTSRDAPNFLRSFGMGIIQGLYLHRFTVERVDAALRHCLTDFTNRNPLNDPKVSNLDNVLFMGPGSDQIATPSALAIQLFKHFTGPKLAFSEVLNNPQYPLQPGSDRNERLSALMTLASVDDKGTTNLIVINQSSKNTDNAQILTGSLGTGTSMDVQVQTLASTNLIDENTPGNYNQVRLKNQNTAIDLTKNAFHWDFPAYSITAFRFSGAITPTKQ